MATPNKTQQDLDLVKDLILRMARFQRHTALIHLFSVVVLVCTALFIWHQDKKHDEHWRQYEAEQNQEKPPKTRDDAQSLSLSTNACSHLPFFSEHAFPEHTVDSSPYTGLVDHNRHKNQKAARQSNQGQPIHDFGIWAYEPSQPEDRTHGSKDGEANFNWRHPLNTTAARNAHQASPLPSIGSAAA